MDLLTITGIALLIFWAAGTFFFAAPGIIHLFLTLGVFLLIFGAVKRAEKKRSRKAR